MALGLGILRLEPRAFWAMTVAEFTAAARAVTPQAQSPVLPTRTSLNGLMARFPDTA